MKLSNNNVGYNLGQLPPLATARFQASLCSEGFNLKLFRAFALRVILASLWVQT